MNADISNSWEVQTVEQLIQKINSMPNSYYEFVDSVIDYARVKESHLDLLVEYLDNNKSATPSDIIKLISYQPDFFDDDLPEDVETFGIANSIKDISNENI